MTTATQCHRSKACPISSLASFRCLAFQNHAWSSRASCPGATSLRLRLSISRKEKRKEAKKSGLEMYRVMKDSGFSEGKGSTATGGEPGAAEKGGESDGEETRLDIRDAESSSIAEAMVVERVMARMRQGKDEIYTCVPDTLLGAGEERAIVYRTLSRTSQKEEIDYHCREGGQGGHSQSAISEYVSLVHCDVGRWNKHMRLCGMASGSLAILHCCPCPLILVQSKNGLFYRICK